MDVQNNRQKARWLLTGRANDAGFILLWKDSMGMKFSPIVITAAFSVILLVGATVWQATKSIETVNPGAVAAPGTVYSVESRWGYGADTETGAETAVQATSAGPNDFSHTENDVFGQLLGTYVALKNAGTYTEEKGAQIADSIAEATVAPVSFTPVAQGDIKTDSDVSYARVLVYRDDVEAALAPMLLNSESELGIFNDYVQTRDTHNLVILGEAAGRYRKTVLLLSAVTVPQDALEYHLGVTNALLQFATTLDAMIQNAGDPMATLALLRTYNSAEQDVYASFNALSSYEKRKTP
ncbi:MAG: hypothetical protein Q8Q13_03370 [bacterium]|nr:hypothetical protein [bacterium]